MYHQMYFGQYRIQNTIDATAKLQILVLTQTRNDALNVDLDDCTHHVTSLFCKMIYRVHIPVRFTSSSLLILAILLHTVAGPSVVSRKLLPRVRASPLNWLSRHHDETQMKKSLTLKTLCLFSSAWRHTRARLVWDSQKCRRWRTAQDVIHPPMCTQDILNWEKTRPMAAEACGN